MFVGELYLPIVASKDNPWCSKLSCQLGNIVGCAFEGVQVY